MFAVVGLVIVCIGIAQFGVVVAGRRGSKVVHVIQLCSPSVTSDYCHGAETYSYRGKGLPGCWAYSYHDLGPYGEFHSWGVGIMIL